MMSETRSSNNSAKKALPLTHPVGITSDNSGDDFGHPRKFYKGEIQMFIRLHNHLYNVNRFEAIVIDEKHVTATFIDADPLVLKRGDSHELQEYWDTIVNKLKKLDLIIVETP